MVVDSGWVVFCLMRRPRCMPGFTAVSTGNQHGLSVTLLGTNRNLLFKTDILVSCHLGSKENGKSARKFLFNLVKKTKQNTTAQRSALTQS